MIEPVSRDLFPPDVCSDEDEQVFLRHGPRCSLYDLRFNFLFHLRNRWEYFAYFSSSSCESYNSQLAALLEDDLGGLGGVW